MTWRIVQRAADPAAPWAALYLVGSGVDPRLRAAAPGWGIAARSDRVLGAQPRDLEPARKLVGAAQDAPVVVGGWSAGCQSVRSLLMAGLRPYGVLGIDGTAGPWPLAANAPEVRVWAELAARARAGECRAALTCTQQTYTEQLPKPKRVGEQGPYASTLTVLRRATGLELQPGTDVVEGSLRVVSSPSKSIDGPAHIHQVQEVLPELLAWIAGQDEADALDVLDVGLSLGGRLLELGSAVRDALQPRRSHTERALALAIAQVGVRETPGAANNPLVSAYLYGCIGRPERGPGAAGKRLGLEDDSNSWCCALVGWTDAQAAEPGELVPVWRAAVWERVADAREDGTWRDVSTGYLPKPGDLCVFKRAGGDPRKIFNQGHIARVSARHGTLFRAVGGNEADQVQHTWRPLASTDIVGWIKRSP